MKEEIVRRLKAIENSEKIKILFAVESGSRAWGFASADSDYDVRFVYVRPKNEYLRLDRVRDVIETPLDGVFDINGWDLDKTLKLLYKSNATLFEWLSSPMVYIQTDFMHELKQIVNRYFSSKRVLYHYLNMAKGNYRESLRDDSVKAKKYFYVLRPILACRWILANGTPPPMLFTELMTSQLDESIKQEVNMLLDIKMNFPEIHEIPRVDKINAYIENHLEKVRDEIDHLSEEQRNDWQELNNLFINTVSAFDET